MILRSEYVKPSATQIEKFLCCWQAVRGAEAPTGLCHDTLPVLTAVRCVWIGRACAGVDPAPNSSSSPCSLGPADRLRLAGHPGAREPPRRDDVGLPQAHARG